MTPVEITSLKFIAEACAARAVNLDLSFAASGISTDSRQVKKNDLFVALRGERFDAHDFVGTVLAEGNAVAALVEEQALERLPGELPCLVAKDTRKALGQIAARYRGQFSIPIIAVGGSNGKTSAKELIGSVLSAKLEIVASRDSFNNDIGVPLTLLNLARGRQAAVVEAGSNHPGELAPLLAMIQPSIGVITSIGREHLEFFGSIEGVVQEEGQVAKALSADGLLLLPGDSPHAKSLAAMAQCRVKTIGFAEGNDAQVCAFAMHANGACFSLRMQGSVEEYRTNLMGRHQLINAALAIVVGKELGLDRSEIQSGLSRAKPAKMRLELMSAGPVSILNDAYNANADSMIAALETMRELETSGRKGALLGNMAELGPFSEACHREVGEKAASSGLDFLMTAGKDAALIEESARQCGMKNTAHFESFEALCDAAAALLKPGDTILLKGSRSSRMERVAEFLQKRFAKSGQEGQL
jgi:UDP-N-acetylmuramoyl-tripeptide--D-alanyl-D-alanine ligase